MSAATRLLAFDLGASSGRAVVGTLTDGRLELHEAHRFHNGPVNILGRLHWNLPALFDELRTGLTQALATGPLESIGVDTWGVDYGLLSESGALLGPVYHYRDRRTDGALDKLLARLSREEVYAATGLQFMPINTLCQLLVAAEETPELLSQARELLFVPDLLNYWLTGVRRSEYTIASTSQMLDIHARGWATALLDKLQLPTAPLPKLIEPGATLGPLHESLGAELDGFTCDVMTTAAHDTAAAVVAIPAQQADGWAYISSGTWSLVGLELPGPIATDAALASNFTNEGGIDGTIRFLKNVAGLWLLQESRRTWAAGGEPPPLDALVAGAAGAPPRVSFVDPDDPHFAPPGDMPARIADFCRETGQPVPADQAQFARCIFESLALKSRVHIDRLEELSGQQLDTIHIVGGGSRNALLCQLTADVSGRRVVAGPVEATAAGNLMVQALGRGLVKSRAEIRAVIAASSELTTYQPQDTSAWAAAFDRFRELLK